MLGRSMVQSGVEWTGGGFCLANGPGLSWPDEALVDVRFERGSRMWT